MFHIYMLCYYRAVGGVQAEREERDRWITKERKRIQDSVDGMYYDISHSKIDPKVSLKLRVKIVMEDYHTK